MQGTLLQDLASDGFWSAIASVRSLPAVAAVSVAMVTLIAWRVFDARYRTIEKAIEKGDESAVKVLVGDVEVDTKGLTKQQRFELALNKLRQNERYLKVVCLTLIVFAGMTLLGWLAWILIVPPPPYPRPTVQLSCTLTRGAEVPSDSLRAMCGRAGPNPSWAYAQAWAMSLSGAGDSLVEPLGELSARLSDEDGVPLGVVLLSREQECPSNASANKPATRDALELSTECFTAREDGTRRFELQLMVCGQQPVREEALSRLTFNQQREGESHAIRCRRI